jgi:hypothetical protein
MEISMTAENFAYWLQGFFEVSQADELTKEQVQEIKNHLELVFNKVTPDYNTDYFLKHYRDELPYATGVQYCQDGTRKNPLMFIANHASC